MREQLTSLTKYDTGIAEYVDLHDAYDETSGDVEAPTGWFGLAGRRIIHHDDRGFVSTHAFQTREDAKQAFDQWDAEYGAWMDDGDDDLAASWFDR